MDKDLVMIIVYIIVILVTLWVYYEIISGATKSRRNIQLQEKQVKLLAKLLEKQGATTEEIDILLSDKK